MNKDTFAQRVTFIRKVIFSLKEKKKVNKIRDKLIKKKENTVTDRGT